MLRVKPVALWSFWPLLASEPVLWCQRQQGSSRWLRLIHTYLMAERFEVDIRVDHRNLHRVVLCIA